MRNTSKTSRSSDVTRDDKAAIRMSGVGKDYKLYHSPGDQALDVMGLSWMRFWRRVKYDKFSALDGIDLTIAQGERVGIIGRNGAGKTTLLKLITGNFAPSVGEIRINGEIQALMHTGVGFHVEFTGYENICASLVYNGLSGDEFNAAVVDVIDFCELGEFLHQPVKTYSQGMLMRLQFATATAIEPDIIIIDEILGAGDAYFAGKSAERMKMLTGRGATLLLVSHSVAQVIQFSERVIWLDHGRIVMEGEPLVVVNHYEEFIHTLAKDAENREETPGGSNTLVEIPKWILEKHASGPTRKDGADWGGNGPLRVVELSLVDRSVDPVKQISAGQAFGIRTTIESDSNGSFPCSCLFVIYDEAGNIVSRLVEPERNYELRVGDSAVVTAWLDGNPIGRGNYTVSAGLYANYNPNSIDKGHRYHILSRGLRLFIESTEVDESRIRLFPSWDATVVKVSPEHPAEHAGE